MERFIEGLHGGEVFQGFEILEVLAESQTPFQHLRIVNSKRLGRVLLLDGVVQTTEKDECMYHEMLVHVPMFACPNPKRVLIIGGGDGGSLREALKHDVERVDMVEIDREVVDLCVEHMPQLNNGGAIYNDPRARLIIDDAFEYLKVVDDGYDVIISDSTDPIGAAEVLFSESFYQLIEKHLRPNGVIALQNGVVFLQPNEPKGVLENLRKLSLHACCYTTVVPSYYGGQMTLGFASNNTELLDINLEKIKTRWDAQTIETFCYTPELHAASFVLPKWIQKTLGS